MYKDLIKDISVLFSKKMKFSFYFIIFLMIISMLFEMLGISLIFPLINQISTNEPIFFVEKIINFFSFFSSLEQINQKITNDNLYRLIFLIFLVLIIFTLKAIILLTLEWNRSKFTFKIQEHISSRLFKGYLSQEYKFHIKNNSSNLIRNIMTEVQVFAIDTVIPTLLIFSDTLVLIGLIIVLIYFQPLITSSALLFLILICILFLKFTKKKITKIGLDRQKYEGARIKHFNQGIKAIKELKILGREKYFFNEFSNHNIGIRNVATVQSFITGLPQVFLEFIAIIGLLGFLTYLISLDITNSNLIATLGLFTAAFFRLMPALYRIISCINRVRYSYPVIKLLSSEIRLIAINKSNKKSLKEKIGSKKDKIIFENVSFKYSEKEPLVFEKLSLEMQLGKIIGITGKSGSGKTTFIDLLIGLLDPTSGSIKINKINITKNSFKIFNSFIYLPQNIYLIDDTIVSNIIFGSKNKIKNLKLLEIAIKNSELSDFVNSLKDGYYNTVGENGSKLSGGQRQRIGIARAIYNKAPILVMDESTSALDHETEEKIILNLKRLNYNKTIIIITHKKNTLNYCENIYEINNNKIYLKK